MKVHEDELKSNIEVYVLTQTLTLKATLDITKQNTCTDLFLDLQIEIYCLQIELMEEIKLRKEDMMAEL